jgi:hypothetical protein
MINYVCVWRVKWPGYPYHCIIDPWSLDTLLETNDPDCYWKVLITSDWSISTSWHRHCNWIAYVNLKVYWSNCIWIQKSSPSTSTSEIAYADTNQYHRMLIQADACSWWIRPLCKFTMARCGTRHYIWYTLLSCVYVYSPLHVNSSSDMTPILNCQNNIHIVRIHQWLDIKAYWYRPRQMSTYYNINPIYYSNPSHPPNIWWK